MHIAAVVIAVLVCVGIVAIGARFLLAPRPAMIGFGLALEDSRALTAIKGVRDIASGAVLVVVWVAAGTTALGWTLLAAAVIPVGDTVIVLSCGGKASTALGVHAVTAALMVAAGLVLALG